MLNHASQDDSYAIDNTVNSMVSVIELEGLVSVRGDSTDPDFVSKVESLTGCALPISPLTSSTNTDFHILWLSPDKWLLVTNFEDVSSIQAELQAVFKDRHVAVTNISDAMVTIQILGDKARELLMRFGTLDFSAERFIQGKVIRASFVDTTIIYHLSTVNPDCFKLYVPRSYGEYVKALILGANI